MNNPRQVSKLAESMFKRSNNQRKKDLLNDYPRTAARSPLISWSLLLELQLTSKQKMNLPKSKLVLTRVLFQAFSGLPNRLYRDVFLQNRRFRHVSKFIPISNGRQCCLIWTVYDSIIMGFKSNLMFRSHLVNMYSYSLNVCSPIQL